MAGQGRRIDVRGANGCEERAKLLDWVLYKSFQAH